MRRITPEITIAKVTAFTPDGMPDHEQYEISAVIDTADEISHLGRLRFENAADLVTLHNILGTYIRMNDLDATEDSKQEGGEANGL